MKIFHYIFSLIFFLIIQTIISGQSNNLLYYFDNDMNITADSSASYLGYGVREKGKIRFSTFHLPDNMIVMKGYFTDSTLAVKDGLFTYYDSLGFATSEGIYKDDLEEGYWLIWKDRLSDSVYYEKGVKVNQVKLTYHPGTELLASRTFMVYKAMTSEILQWDTTGRLISKAIWMKGDGETYTYHPNGKIKEIKRTPAGEKPSSFYFNETGEDITKQVRKDKSKDEPDFSGWPNGGDKPVYPGGREEFFDFIKRNLKFTATQFAVSSYGRSSSSVFITISFMLDKSGNAKNVEVKGVVPDMAGEVASLIGRMPSWKMNGLKSYGPINISLNISITFW